MPICGNGPHTNANRLWFKAPVAVPGILPARTMPRSNQFAETANEKMREDTVIYVGF
jgi:hypothetical protein